MGKRDTNNTTALAQAFGVIGNGSAEIAWVEHYTQGACTIKLGQNRWGIVLPEGDTPVQLHEMGHVLFTSFETNAISAKLTPIGRELLAVLEDARVDTKAGEWYREDLKGDHARRIVVEGLRGGNLLLDDVVKLAYNLDLPLNEAGTAVKAKFGRRIDAVQTSDDPWATARLAFEIQALYEDGQLGPIQDQAQNAGQGADAVHASDVPPTAVSTSEAKTLHEEGGSDQPQGQDNGLERGGSLDELDLRNELPHEGDRQEDWWDQMVVLAVREAEEVRKKVEWDRRKASPSTGEHKVQIIDAPQEPTKLSIYGELVLDETAGLGRQTKRHGRPTPDVWKLGLYGETKVFTRPPKRKGRLIVLVDLSGSVGCWCEEHKGSARYGRTTSGWKEWQVASTISRRLPDATVIGFSGAQGGTYIVPIDPGNQPVCNEEMPSGIGGSTPICGALDYAKTLLDEALQDSTLVVITDGSPNDCSANRDPEQHTSELSHQLVKDGAKFVLVLVDCNRTDLYPAEVTIEVNSDEDLLEVSTAISAILERR